MSRAPSTQCEMSKLHTLQGLIQFRFHRRTTVYSGGNEKECACVCVYVHTYSWTIIYSSSKYGKCEIFFSSFIAKKETSQILISIHQYIILDILLIFKIIMIVIHFQRKSPNQFYLNCMSSFWRSLINWVKDTQLTHCI